jgi:hypothetical protein
MIIAFLLQIRLPGLNRQNCELGANGYTCDDLDSGLLALETLLARPRRHSIRFQGDAYTDSERLYVRLLSVSWALATDSVPVLTSSSLVNAPSFAVIAEKKLSGEPSTTIPFCTNSTSLDQDAIVTVAMNPGFLLFNPTLNRLYDILGPASLHILMHLALNLSDPVPREEYDYLVGKINCEKYQGETIGVKPRYDEILSAVRAHTVIELLPSMGGLMINLIRGQAPVLYDQVGGACWNAQSYLAGGINPLYPGTGRSTLDLSRCNEACPESKYTKQMLKALL